MRAFLLNGSPRTEGSTNLLLDNLESLLVAHEFEVEQVCAMNLLSEMETPFCTHCSSVCQGTCYRDTAVEDFFQRLPAADCLVAASPVYFGTVSAQIKALWDLSRKTRSERGLLYTVGAALAVGGGRFGGQETTIRAIHDMMFIQGMIIAGDSSSSGIGHQGVAAEDPASEDANAQKRLRILAEALSDVAEATRDMRQSARKK